MRIIPVIDLQAGRIVRAIAGERQRYRPIVSPLVADATPAAVARAFVSQFQFDTAYVADLDAIAGAAPNWDALRAINRAGLRVCVDAGVTDTQRARELAAFDGSGARLAGIIVGLESTTNPRQLAEWFDCIGPAQAIFSLDLKHGQPLSASPAWRGINPADIARTAFDAGFRRLIVLDLADVGTNTGSSVAPLCREILARQPQVELIAGGGVRNIDDLRRLHDAGCRASLVASALHDGRITLADLREIATW